MEEADLDELAKTRQESQAEMDKHLADTNAVLDTMRDEVSLKPGPCVFLAMASNPEPMYKYMEPQPGI